MKVSNYTLPLSLYQERLQDTATNDYTNGMWLLGSCFTTAMMMLWHFILDSFSLISSIYILLHLAAIVVLF